MLSSQIASDYCVPHCQVIIVKSDISTTLDSILGYLQSNNWIVEKDACAIVMTIILALMFLPICIGIVLSVLIIDDDKRLCRCQKLVVRLDADSDSIIDSSLYWILCDCYHLFAFRVVSCCYTTRNNSK